MIQQTDVILKTIIELGIEDLRKNPYLVQDALSQMISSPLLRSKYGQKEIDNAVEWLKNNAIDVAMVFRNDKDKFPLVTIQMNSSPQKVEYGTLNDDTPDSVTLKPNDISKPIPFIVNPFTPISYDKETGFVETPSNVRTSRLRAGQILVDPTTGNGWQIIDTNCGLYIEPGSDMNATQLAVVPQYAFYRARVKQQRFTEQWTIGCHCHGDPSTLLWLHTLVFYILLKYRLTLEANGLAEIVLSHDGMQPNSNWGSLGGETIFSRNISMSAVVEHTWLEEPARMVEAAVFEETVDSVIKTGIKVLSNYKSDNLVIDTENESWLTVKDED